MIIHYTFSFSGRQSAKVILVSFNRKWEGPADSVLDISSIKLLYQLSFNLKSEPLHNEIFWTWIKKRDIYLSQILGC